MHRIFICIIGMKLHVIKLFRFLSWNEICLQPIYSISNHWFCYVRTSCIFFIYLVHFIYDARMRILFTIIRINNIHYNKKQYLLQLSLNDPWSTFLAIKKIVEIGSRDIELFVHLSRKNFNALRLIWLLMVAMVRTESNHTGSTSFQTKKKSSKSVYSFDSSEVANIRKTVGLITSSFFWSREKNIFQVLKYFQVFKGLQVILTVISFIFSPV